MNSGTTRRSDLLQILGEASANDLDLANLKLALGGIASKVRLIDQAASKLKDHHEAFSQFQMLLQNAAQVAFALAAPKAAGHLREAAKVMAQEWPEKEESASKLKR